MKQLTLLGMILTCLLGLGLWHEQLFVAKAAHAFATLTVNNTNDSGAGSLRQAIADAASGDTISFDTSGAFATPQTITLTSGELVVNKSLQIQGPGASQLTVSGGSVTRVFNIGSDSGAYNVTLSGLSIANGRSSGANRHGGGILNQSTGTINVTACTLVGNSVADDSDPIGGGAIASFNGVVNVTNSTLTGNSAVMGGGIRTLSSSSVVNVVNSTISGNLAIGKNSLAGVGGGIANSGGTVTLTNSTITGNMASSQPSLFVPAFGGGVWTPSTSTVNVRNTIIAGNILSGSTSSSGPDVSGNFASQGYNLIGNNSDSSGFTATGDQVNVNPLLSPLADNGGPTQTHALQAGSPAIDAGSNALAVDAANQPLTTDQRDTGFPRINGSTVDIGSYEDLFNTQPTITGTTIALQAGSAAASSLIATVNDVEDDEDTLSVTATPLSGSGVTLSGIGVDSSGNVTANVLASCNASNSTITLRVTDNGNLIAEAILDVSITPNQGPVLGTYPVTNLPQGVAALVPPNAAPSDNGSIVSLTATAPGFTGTFSGDPATGLIFVNNAGPAGFYTVSVTATDNCGAITTSSFSLTVGNPPSIVSIIASRQKGSPASISQIGVAFDTNQPANTLSVSVNGSSSATVNGVTLSGISVDATGRVLASVVANCISGNAGFTLTVTDAQNMTANTTVSVTVSDNTPPTLGTYAAATVTTGSTTTVSPTAAPADNGLVNSLTVAAPGFTGTLSVNAAGVVSIANAGPAGNYVVTVTATDNCGLQTPRTFNLTVAGIPVLGNYPATSVQLSGNTTVTPDAPPSGLASITVSTSTSFKGTLVADPLTGVVRVMDAHPAQTLPGAYTVTVKGLNNVGTMVTRTFLLTVTTPVTCNPEAFVAKPDINAGSAPIAVAVGDFNSDGKQDLAVANFIPGTGTASIRLGDGLGGFSGSTAIIANGQATGVSVGDFNGDGKQDLAIPNFSTSTVSIRLGNGLGGFSGSTNLTGYFTPRSVAIGDFNNDGKQDFVAGNQDSTSASVRLGDGLGGFSGSTNVFVGVNAPFVTLGDFNNDGNQDLAAAGGTIVSIRLGDGLGGFSGSTTVSVGSFPGSIAIGDFNGDGNQDFATANGSSNDVSIRLGNGLGGFSNSTTLTGFTTPRSIAISDFNGDGKQDFAVTNANTGMVSIRLGDGLGGFSGSTNLPVGSQPLSIAIGDFNSDGKQDFATANLTSHTVSVRLRYCLPTISASPVSSQQGSPASLSQIATVSDGDQPANTLSVSVNGSSSATVNGVTLSGISVDGSGNVTASVAAECAATDASFTLTVTDNSGATATATLNVTVSANTAPTLGTYAATTVTATGATTVTPTAAPADNGSVNSLTVAAPGFTGTLSVNAAGVVSIANAGPAGNYVVTVTATDNCGLQTTVTFNLSVTSLFNFVGFFQPVDNAPTVNSVNAGQAVPIKFSLTGYQGMAIFATGFPASQSITCSSGIPDASEETVTAGSSSLSYDATTDRYTYVWKTEKAWKGTCRKLVVRFTDGSTHEALFQFR